MTIKNLLIEELDNTTVMDTIDELNEGWFMTTPFIAFSAFKRGAFKSLNNSNLFSTIRKVKEGKPIDTLKAGALVKKEQIKHAAGMKSGKGEDATVYKLTPEQIKVMGEIYKKHGQKIIDEIYTFRKNVLAPYQIIKRLVKKNKSLTFKEVHGLTYDEYKSALESGRKKILKRGDFFDRAGEKYSKIDEYEQTISNLEAAKKSFGQGDSAVSNSMLNKVYEKFNLGDDEMFGFSPEELKIISDEIASNFSKLRYYMSHPETKIPPEDIVTLISNNVGLKSGDASNERVAELLKSLNKENIKKGELSLALAKYMLRKEIRDKIKSSDPNIYKAYYSELIDEMIKKIKDRKKNVAGSAASDKMAIEFNDKEEKVWGKLPSSGGADFTGKLENYYQKITDEDFKGVQHFQKPAEVETAQRAIENEIKRFERKLVKIIGEDDVNKLKRYRLINNLITVKELKDPGSLFKSEEDLNREEETYQDQGEEDTGEDQAEEEQADDGEDEEGSSKEGYISDDEFFRRIREYATMEYDTMAELNNAKKQVDALVLKMKKQGSDEIVKKHQNILMQIRRRRTTEPTDIKGDLATHGDIVTVNDVEQFARNMLKKKYSSIDEIKQDKIIFDKMVDKYKEDEPDAERNLKEIQFVLDQVERKLEGQLGQYLE